MDNLKAFLAGFGLSALVLMIWSGCDSSERVQQPTESKPRIGATDLIGSSEYDRELIAAKNGTVDPIQSVAFGNNSATRDSVLQGAGPKKSGWQ